jgi:hypothetical protein
MGSPVDKTTDSADSGRMTLFEEREKNLQDAISFREPKKVPVMGDFWLYPFHYAGTTYYEVKDDPEKALKAYLKIFDDLNFDGLHSSGLGYCVEAHNELGRFDYYRNPYEGSVIHNPGAQIMMTAEDYPALIDDPVTFRFETLAKRRYTALSLPKEEAVAAIQRAAEILQKHRALDARIKATLRAEKQIYPLISDMQFVYMSKIHLLFSHVRGIRDTLVDLRRRPELVRQASEALWPLMASGYDLDQNVEYPALPLGFTGYHCEGGFISPAQYDEFFFEPFKEYFGPFMEAGKKFFLQGEGRFVDTIDRFRQLPKGAMVIKPDMDDPFELYREIGDWATIACGIMPEMLAVSSRQECIDYVKRCFDTFAPGGGFIFMPQSPLLSGHDTKIENLIAVYETADELSRG